MGATAAVGFSVAIMLTASFNAVRLTYPLRMLASPIFYEKNVSFKRGLVVDIRRPSLSFPMSNSGQENNENPGFPPAVFSAEGPVVSGPLQYSPPNFNNPEPPPCYFPPQGPPTYPLYQYQDNPLPLQGPNGLTWQAPQNATVFGLYPATQYPYIEQHTAYVNPSYVGVAIDHGLSAQPQFHPTGPVPQYPVPMNAAGPVDAVTVTYETPWHNEDDRDGDQSRGKRSYRHIIDKLLT
jgi:hypothetical protein